MKSFSNITEFNLPLIETERLLLRMFEARDLDFAFRLFNDDEVQKYISPENRRTREQMKVALQNFVKRWQERGFGLWCVSEKSGGKMFGYGGFQYFDRTTDVEVLFAFSRNFWGKGFATETAKACLRFGFEELRLEKIFAAVHFQNTASRRVLEKIGMTYEKREPHYGVDTIVYVISRDDFEPPEDIYKLIYGSFDKQQMN